MPQIPDDALLVPARDRPEPAAHEKDCFQYTRPTPKSLSAMQAQAYAAAIWILQASNVSPW